MGLNTTAATYVSGEVVTAAKLNLEVRDAFTGIQSAWVAWTPTLTGLVLGNGTMLARYRQIGKTVEYRIKFTAGSTSTFSGSFTLSLPVTPKADYGIDDAAGTITLYDNSVGNASRTGGIAAHSGVNTIYLLAAALVTNLSPWTWAVSDRFSVVGLYEAA